MTQRSFLWDGTAVGDATLAPYAKDLFKLWFSAPVGSLSDDAKILPGLYEDFQLEISGGGIPALTISGGGATLKNYIFLVDNSTHFSVVNNENSGYHRYDSIILRLDYNEDVQKITLEKLRGTEAAAFPPTAPTLTQDTDLKIWEVELYRIYVNDTDYQLLQKYVYDYRKFLHSFEDTHNYCDTNLLRNSEFMAFSGAQSAGVDYPEFWIGVGTPSAVASAALLEPMSRGRSINVTGGGIGQLVLHNTKGQTYSFRGLVELVAGTAIVKFHGILASGLNTVKQIEIYIAESGVQEFAGTVTFDEDTVEQLYIEVNATGTDQFKLGQVLVAEGYHTGPFRQIQETLLFRNYLTDTSWDGDFKSDGTTLIDLSASFGAGVVLDYTRAIVYNARIRDSGAAAVNDCKLQVAGEPFSTVVYGELQIGRHVADRWQEKQGLVPVDQDLRQTGDPTPQFNIIVDAQGVNTMDVYFEIVGIIT